MLKNIIKFNCEKVSFISGKSIEKYHFNFYSEEFSQFCRYWNNFCHNHSIKEIVKEIHVGACTNNCLQVFNRRTSVSRSRICWTS
jgi:hypothetical protein